MPTVGVQRLEVIEGSPFIGKSLACLMIFRDFTRRGVARYGLQTGAAVSGGELRVIHGDRH